MTTRSLTVFFSLILFAQLPLSAAEPTKEQGAEVARVTELLTGSFSSEEQSKADQEFFDVRLNVGRIWAERKGEHWLYVEQAMAASPDKPYRQRVYQIVWADGAVVSRVFELPDAKGYVGGWKKAELFARLTPEKLTERTGCAVTLKPADGGGYTGGTTGKGCGSELKGAKYATSEVTLTADALTSWDRGFDADGKQVWGAAKGAYQFRRLKAEER